MDRHTVLRAQSGALPGALTLAAVLDGATPAHAAARYDELLGDPVQTGQELPFPMHLTREERRNLETFDEADFVVYTGQQWHRFGESHAPDVRVHWPDGHYTDGLEPHIEDMKVQFTWAPDIHINQHPIRIAKGNLTAVTGVWQGTFTGPMPDGNGGLITPTGKQFAIHMLTLGIWNQHGVMDEEFLFMDLQTLNQQLGLA